MVNDRIHGMELNNEDSDDCYEGTVGKKWNQEEEEDKTLPSMSNDCSVSRYVSTRYFIS